MKPVTRRKINAIADVVLSPVVYPAAKLLGFVRRVGVANLRRCHRALLRAGVFPIRNHYYEPQFDFTGSPQNFDEPRTLPGIDWNVERQLETLASMTFADELLQPEAADSEAMAYTHTNLSFGPGDGEYWYQLLRLMRPRRIIEIGSGNSTLLAIRAIEHNRREDQAYECEHICIEPFEMPWLEQAPVTVVRECVENLDLEFFSALGENDVLFIDSSHVIRPEGDVTFEYLQLLPSLKPGVIVHVHDIFSPRNYPKWWIVDHVRLWNEQYLLEAFLTDNTKWEVVGALNLLQHDHHAALREVAPFLEPQHEPGSFYLRKLV